MIKHLLRQASSFSSVALLSAGLVGVLLACPASAQKKSAPKAAAPAHSAPSHGASAGAGRSNAGGAHGGSAGARGGASRGPSANGAHGPTANGARGAEGGRASGPRTGPGDRGGGARNSSFGGRAAPRGGNDRVARNGANVRTRADGRVSDIHDSRRGMDVHHGLNGGRRVSVDRPGHGRIEYARGRRGYVQRGYSYHGRDFGRRAYFYHGHEYNRYYRGYGYRGLYLNVYAPGFYYGAGFYGWAYNPWAVAIAYPWGWAGNPWFGFYGAYFVPYAVYPSAAFWLTDYIISQDLQAAYAAHVEANEADGVEAAAGGGPLLSPEVKQQIADEIKGQLALENAEAAQNTAGQDADPGSSGIARLLSDGRPHVFVVGASLDLTDTNNQECSVSDGDALQLQSPPPADATSASLIVLAAKGGNECQPNSTVTVQLADLQEMQNHMRETIDQGLQDLQAKQGKDGIPAAPPSAQAAPTQPQYATVAPPPDPNDAQTIQSQDQQADQAEQEASNGAPPPTGPSSTEPPPPTALAAPPATTAPASVSLGQTLAQVKAALGAPLREANLGPKVIYYYNGMKVTFKNGKVSDVE